MNLFNTKGLLFTLIFIICFPGCKSTEQWAGQAPIRKVSTKTVPIQRQYAGVFDLGNGVFISNDYSGVDLNRDWENFNQPETRAIRDFMRQKVADTGGTFYFGVDFHSTWEDIFYTITPELKGNMPGLVPNVIAGLEGEFPGYKPNIRPSPGTGNKINSTAFFFFEFGAESFTYEVGDNTPREFVRKKGEVTAIKLMEQLLK